MSFLIDITSQFSHIPHTYEFFFSLSLSLYALFQSILCQQRRIVWKWCIERVRCKVIVFIFWWAGLGYWPIQYVNQVYGNLRPKPDKQHRIVKMKRKKLQLYKSTPHNRIFTMKLISKLVYAKLYYSITYIMFS